MLAAGDEPWLYYSPIGCIFISSIVNTIVIVITRILANKS